MQESVSRDDLERIAEFFEPRRNLKDAHYDVFDPSPFGFWYWSNDQKGWLLNRPVAEDGNSACDLDLGWLFGSLWRAGALPDVTTLRSGTLMGCVGDKVNAAGQTPLEALVRAALAYMGALGKEVTSDAQAT